MMHGTVQDPLRLAGEAELASPSDRLFNRWMPVGIGLGFLAITLAAISAVWVVSDLQQHSRLVDHTHQVERHLLTFQGRFERAETARRGFLLSGVPAMEATYRTSAADARASLGQVGRLVGDNPAQQQRLDRLRVLVLDHLAGLERSIAAIRRGDGDAARSDFRRDAATGGVPAIRTLVGEMIGEETRLLEQRSATQAHTVERLYVILILTGLLILPVAIGSFWIIRRHTRELARSRDLLRELNASLEDKVAERTVDCGGPTRRSSASPISCRTTCARRWSTSWGSLASSRPQARRWPRLSIGQTRARRRR